MGILPISAVVPTRHRSQALARTLESLTRQDAWPEELFIVDASDDEATKSLLESFADKIPKGATIRRLQATERGAAVQRNQGVAAAKHDVIWFFDDDILFEPGCVIHLWDALQSSPQIGATNAMITNQKFSPPGRATRIVFRLLGAGPGPYAGRIIGPAINLLPEDRPDLPPIVPVEWVNTTCTLYRREALPNPVFDSHFTGYSMFEDVTLSATIARNWKLVNARTARIYHDSQPGDHKRDPAELAEMALFNRHHVMSHVLGRTGVAENAKLAAWLMFQHLASLRSAPGRATLAQRLKGEARALRRIRALRK